MRGVRRGEYDLVLPLGSSELGVKGRSRAHSKVAWGRGNSERPLQEVSFQVALGGWGEYQ